MRSSPSRISDCSLAALVIAAGVLVSVLIIGHALGPAPAEASPSAAVWAQEDDPPAPSDCRPTTSHVVGMDRVPAGETVPLTLTVSAGCPDRTPAVHLAVIVDATGDLEHAKDIARYWIRNVVMDTHPHSYASVIEISNRARRVCPLTNDRDKAEDCLNKLRPSSLPSRSDFGIKETVETLLRARKGVGESRTIHEAFHLFTDAAGERCSTIEREAKAAAKLGIRFRASCASRGTDRCDSHCISDIRSHNEGALALGAEFLFPKIVPPIRLQTLLVTDTFAANMPLVDGSANPTPASAAPDGSSLLWRATSVSSQTFRLQLRPLEVGTWPVSPGPVHGSFVDQDGGVGSIVFEIPDIDVYPAPERPTQAPTMTPEPTAEPTPTRPVSSATPTPEDRPQAPASLIYLPRLLSERPAPSRNWLTITVWSSSHRSTLP